MIRITDLKLDLKYAINKELEISSLKRLVFLNYNVDIEHILSLTLYKKAIDARKKEHVHFVYSIDIELKNEAFLLEKGLRNIGVSPLLTYHEVESGIDHLTHPPVVVGFGPSGIFAALLLARRGYHPVVLERGSDVDRRSDKVDQFWKTGKYSEDSTILFGEGGAGTFSDGKLTTLINDLRCRYILESLVSNGADSEIMYINKPHIGTDILKIILKNMRQEIISYGGQIRFNSKVTDFLIEGEELNGLVINDQEKLLTNICLLGIGHSARDTFDMLYEKKLNISQKPFSIGVRIEHPQKMINQSQYGEFADHQALGAADYKLSYHASNDRSAYTFCMCPGGYVMCATSEDGGVVTNGMSESKRDGTNANSALLVNVNPSDFGSSHPLAGVTFQRDFEKKAFELAGSNYYAPIQLVGDFLKDQNSNHIGQVIPSYLPGYSFVKMTDIFPKYITDTMKQAIINFNHKIKGFAMYDAILTGVETRSSSPIRMIRDENHESNIKGIYPMGEGAGYAGGIMSSAVDGLKTAEIIIKKYNNQGERK